MLCMFLSLIVTEQERLEEIEEEWTKLLERHKALLALINKYAYLNTLLATNTHNFVPISDTDPPTISLNRRKQDVKPGIAYDYGTDKPSGGGSDGSDASPSDEEEDSLLTREADILQYVDDLNERDRQTLNEMARRYGIGNYVRLLRVAKRDRDDKLVELRDKEEVGSVDAVVMQGCWSKASH